MSLDLASSVVSSLTLADYTRPALIVPQLRESDAAGIISELSHVLQREGFLSDLLPFYHTALNQELLGNSAQESGLGFPHARLASIKQLQFRIRPDSMPGSLGCKRLLAGATCFPVGRSRNGCRAIPFSVG